MKKESWKSKLHLPNWLVGILALVLILRIPSFFEPYYYGDEMIYLTLGQGVRQGMTLYKDLHDNKPPLLYLTAAAAGSLFWFKAILAFWNLFTIVLFYKLSKVLFGPPLLEASEGQSKNIRGVKLSTLLFALLTTLPLLEGNTVNAELFMVGPTILAFYILLKKNPPSQSASAGQVFIAGILFGVATLFKIPAAFEAPVIVFYWIFTLDLKTQWKTILKNTLTLTTGFTLPLILTFVWYFFKGALPEYIKAAFLQNVGYVSSFRPGDVQKSFIVRNLPLLTRAFTVMVGAGILFLSRKKISKKFAFLCIWTLFALFAVTLSERPYPHYLIQIVSPLSLFIAIFFTEQSFEQSLVVFPLFLTFFVPVYYKFYYYPTTTHYQRFIDFATHKIDKTTYFFGFSKDTNRNYEIAKFISISTSPTDRIFVWDQDSPTIYALARRLPSIKYTVPYHVSDYSNNKIVATELAKSLPKLIVTVSGNPFSELNTLIQSRYVLLNQIGNANIFVRTNLVANP